MKNMKFFPLSLVLILLGGCATTTPESQTAGAPTFTEEEKAAMSEEEKVELYNASASEPDKLVCRREVVTGSHKRRTVCRTQAERERDREDSQEALGRIVTGTAGSPGGTN